MALPTASSSYYSLSVILYRLMHLDIQFIMREAPVKDLWYCTLKTSMVLLIMFKVFANTADGVLSTKRKLKFVVCQFIII